jgi:hypothetical protein
MTVLYQPLGSSCAAKGTTAWVPGRSPEYATPSAPDADVQHFRSVHPGGILYRAGHLRAFACARVLFCSKYQAKRFNASPGAAFQSIETFVRGSFGHLHNFAMVATLNPLLLVSLRRRRADATEP